MPIARPEAVEGVRPDAVRVWLLMGVRLLRSGRWCVGRRGVSAHSIEFAQIVSEMRPAYQGIKYYIYDVLEYFQTKITLNYEIMRKLFGSIRFCSYLCST